MTGTVATPVSALTDTSALISPSSRAVTSIIWAGSAGETWSTWPPVLAFSSSGVPVATTLPWSMTTMSCASWSASSRYCVVSSTVTPSATSPRIMPQTSVRLTGSSPVVGSSRYSTLGLPTRLAARSRRRRMPPE